MASRIRCASPPDRVPAARQRQVLETDVEQEPEACLHLLEHLPGDCRFPAAEGEAVEEGGALGDGQVADLGDGLLVDARGHGDRQDLRPQPGAGTRGTRHVAHIAVVAFLHLLRLGVLHPPLEEGHHALEIRVVGAHPAVPVLIPHVHLIGTALQHGLACLRRQVLPRGVHGKAQVFGQAGEQPGEVLRRPTHRPRRDRAVGEAQFRIRHHEFRVDLLADAEAGALGARAVGRVERERAGLEVVDVERVRVGAGEPFGEAPLPVVRVLVTVDELEHDDAVGEAQRRLHRVGEPLLRRPLDGQAVHHHLDVVLLLLLQLRRVGERIHRAVDADTRVALCVELVEEVDELALARAHHRREHLETGALLHREHLIHDLLRRLLRDPLATDRAVRGAGAREQQAQVVVDLGDGPDRRTRVAVGRLLVDGHGRRQALDEVDVGLVHLAEELARVRGQRLHVAALPLGEDRVEREARFPGPGQAGEDDEAVPRQIEIDPPQVVFARASDDQAVRHRLSLLVFSTVCFRPTAMLCEHSDRFLG